MLKRIGLIIIMLTFLSMIIPFNMARAQGTATVQLTPQASTVGRGTTFTVNLSVADVTNLAVWEFRLFYLSSVLNCTGAVKGPFLESGGSSQFFTFAVYGAYNATHGCLLFGSSLLGQVPGVNGSGTLATITFQAMAAGDTSLHFDNDPIWNFLQDSSPPPRHLIPYTANDGTVHVTGVGHDLAVTAITLPKTIFWQTYTGKINVTTQNPGDYTETFNLTLYANTTVIDTIENIGLESAKSIIIVFNWNPTGFAKGNYTIWAYAWPVLGETNTVNNNFTGGWVIVAMVGDLTGSSGWPDGKCDMRDIALVARHFVETVPPAPANCDVTGPTLGVPDGKIDMRDISLVARNFGKTDP